MKVRLYVSVVLALCLCLTLLPAMKIQADSVTYDATAAVAYANAHWDDGVGLCAEFVSNCLAVGGVSIPNQASYYSYSTLSYNNNSGELGWYTNPYTCAPALLLYLSEHYAVITNPVSSDIAVGDVVFMLGGSNSDSRDAHVGIIISVDGGVPVYAAHNRATKTGRFSSSYPCTYVVKMGGSLTAPEMPTISTTAPYYAEGSTISISWNAIWGNSYYWINLYKDGELIINQSMDNQTTYTLENAARGEYTFAVSANNSIGTSGGTQYSFLVGIEPKKPQASIIKTFYTTGETVTANWEPILGNTYYWVSVYRDGELIINQTAGDSTTFTMQADLKGTYEIQVSANNGAGTSGSSKCWFLVDIAPEKPEICNTTHRYDVGDSVVVEWSEVVGNVFYWINVYKEDELIIDQTAGDQNIFTIPSVNEGIYKVFVSANNSAGTSGSDCYVFVVGDSVCCLPGDITGDGEVNNKDLTRLFRYLSDYDVEVVEAALDINGDGAVNNKDLTRLFRYLSHWDVELH